MAIVKTRKFKNYETTTTTLEAIGRSHILYKFKDALSLTRKLAQLIKEYGLDKNLQGREVACYVFFHNLEISLHL